MRKRTLMWCAVLIVMLMSAAAWAIDYGPKYWTPTEEVVTPHIKWAKPDAQGPLKVLFIVSRMGMREVVELAQRMELQYTVFAVGGHYYAFRRYNEFVSYDKHDPDRSRDEEALAEDIEEKLDGTYDLIVMGAVNLKTFPLSVRYKLLKKVKEGTPLIGFKNYDGYYKRATARKEKPDLQALFPYKGLPAFAGYKDREAWLDATLELAAFGKGKILTLKGYNVPPGLQALTPGPTGNILEPKFAEYDYYLAWIGQLMRFMSGRMSVQVTGRDYVLTNRCDLAGVEYSVSGPEGKAVTCAFAFRNDNNEVLAGQEKQVKLSGGGTAVSFGVPRPPAGRYFADLWVKEGGKVLAFGSSFVELTGDTLIDGIELKTDYRQEEKVTGKIRIATQKAASGLGLLLRQRDTYGRVTSRARLDVPALEPNAAREMSFELSGGKPLAIVQYLEVELRKDNEVLDRERKAFSISNLSPGEDIRVLHFMGNWGNSPYSYPGYRMFAELAKAVFDTQYAYVLTNAFLANIRSMPCPPGFSRLADKKTDHYRSKSRTADDHVREPCLTDPEYRKELADDLAGRAENGRLFSTTEFSMGDECLFVEGAFELCFSPTCAAAFHKFLAEEYRTVEAMNGEYGTAYKSFDEVLPITLKRAKKETNLQPLWVDYRRHMESTWAGIFPFCAEVIRKIVPGAKIGYEGSDTQVNSYRGADHYKLMQAMQINGTYDGAYVPHAVASFASPGTVLGLGWYGGYNAHRCPEFQRYIAWRHLFRGANSYWIYTANACGQQSVMAPDMSFYDFFQANMAELREIKRGAGKLLMTAQRADDGVAVLYSAASVHVGTLTDGLPVMERVLNALVTLLEDAGFQFKIISYEQLAAGELKKGGYQALWMPYVQALSRKEAAEVESFARAGGTVLADLRPGVRDEHGKPYENGGILDDVFGVKQLTAGPIATNCDVSVNLEGYSGTIKKVDCDWSLGLGAGEARASLAGKKPALIINRHEQGKAILLNFSLSAYAEVAGALENSSVKAGEYSAEFRELFRALMAQSAVEKPATFEPELAGVRLYRFAREGMIYLGVLQELPEPVMAYTAGEARPLSAKKAELKLREKSHIYDSRLGKYLGRSDRIRTMLEPAKGMLFALMPYEVKGIKLNVPRLIGQGETLAYEVEIEAVEPPPGLHVFHVELLSPEGERIPYYAGNVVGEKGMAKGSFSLALNEATGKWKIMARDAATGVSAERTFAVEERK
ncbi:MAG: beta-galactosidase [Kiritimatiellae bacterium]|nr:beta-galactosidase [Kiritimatiellia bacterium]